MRLWKWLFAAWVLAGGALADVCVSREKFVTSVMNYRGHTVAPRPPKPQKEHGKPRQPGPSSSGRTLPAECKIWGPVFDDAPPIKGGVNKQNVRATYHYYAGAGYETSTLACADRFWKDPNHGHKLLKYPWTAYCLDGRSFNQNSCGKCLKVTNQRTGAFVTARAVDNGGCSDTDGTGLDLDPCAFNAIDTDGAGLRDGHMRVRVQEVECGSDATL